MPWFDVAVFDVAVFDVAVFDVAVFDARAVLDAHGASHVV